MQLTNWANKIPHLLLLNCSMFAKLLHFCPHVHFMQLRMGKVLPNDAQQDFLHCAPIGHVGAADVELALQFGEQTLRVVESERNVHFVRPFMNKKIKKFTNIFKIVHGCSRF